MSWPLDVLSMTERTLPSWPILHSVTRAIFQSFRCFVSRSTTTSPGRRLRCCRTHFERCWRVFRYSFRQRTQNSLVRCWMRRHRRRQNISACSKSPGGGRTTLDVLVSRFTGARGIKLFTSDRLSTVSGLELIIPSTSTSSIRKPSSVRLVRLTRFVFEHTDQNQLPGCSVWEWIWIKHKLCFNQEIFLIVAFFSHQARLNMFPHVHFHQKRQTKFTSEKVTHWHSFVFSWSYNQFSTGF